MWVLMTPDQLVAWLNFDFNPTDVKDEGNGSWSYFDNSMGIL